MKRYLLFAVAVVMMACSNNNSSAGKENPNKVHPESESIPDSLKVVNDSAIVPESDTTRR
jgi:hypothetical protein